MHLPPTAQQAQQAPQGTNLAADLTVAGSLTYLMIPPPRQFALDDLAIVTVSQMLIAQRSRSAARTAPTTPAAVVMAVVVTANAAAAAM
jgi:hypothetical protein